LLIAAPTKDSFEVVDAFSRIVRLGEGASRNGKLSQAAMDRTISALRVCSNKLKWHKVERFRLIATEACRMTDNGAAFMDRVRDEVGLDLEIIDRATEARLAVAGASPLICPQATRVLVFDIGGGSTELVWLEIDGTEQKISAWTSIPAGVVTVAEEFGGVDVDETVFEAMRAKIRPVMQEFARQTRQFCNKETGPCHLLGTSGTVTTICGIHLQLPRYDRSQVDGRWLAGDDMAAVTTELLSMSHAQRAASPCIGTQRADLVMAGCAIFEEIRALWPTDRIRVADRGLREGILASLMKEDGVYGQNA
jgi:exopolyphosphatase/guanosine-5'-triphosphate,3'-diphosphate pyrophosphatase